MRKRLVRHQLFLPEDVSARFVNLASEPGVTRSALLAQAVTTMLERRGYTELNAHFGSRVNGMAKALGRVERNQHVLLETLALFVRYQLAIHPPLDPEDRAGRAAGERRFERFVELVARQAGGGKASIAPDFGDGEAEA